MHPMYQPGAPLRLTHAWSTTAARAMKNTDQEFTVVRSFQRQRGHSRFSLCSRIKLVRRNMTAVGMRSRRIPSQ